MFYFHAELSHQHLELFRGGEIVFHRLGHQLTLMGAAHASESCPPQDTAVLGCISAGHTHILYLYACMDGQEGQDCRGIEGQGH